MSAVPLNLNNNNPIQFAPFPSFALEANSTFTKGVAIGYGSDKVHLQTYGPGLGGMLGLKNGAHGDASLSGGPVIQAWPNDGDGSTLEAAGFVGTCASVRVQLIGHV